jgi:hypothetical protein
VVIGPVPDRVMPGSAPGGIVMHVYGTVSGRLLAEDWLAPGADVEALARVSINRAIEVGDVADDFLLVCFDGDSGERMLNPPPGMGGSEEN